MNQQEVLRKALELLVNGGGVTIVGGKSIWNGSEEWQKQTVAVIKKFLGEERRAGKGTYRGDERRHEEVLAEFPFSKQEVQQVQDTLQWDIEKIIGNLYSTSFATKHLFGDNVEQFEQELKSVLLKLNPKGNFTERRLTQVILAWK